MQRPEFITNEDIIRWSEMIDNDSTIPEGFADLILLREVIYAGLWLGEQLLQLKCNPALITRILYTAGGLSFGKDPWVIHQEMLRAYQNNELEFEIDYDNI